MANKKNDNGFSYIDVMIGLLILMIGVLGSASALTYNLLRSYGSEKQIIAKQIVNSTIESVFATRDIQINGADPKANWGTIGNVGNNPVGGVPKGIFLTGWCPIREDLGADGVAGTSDDACAATTVCPSGPGQNSSAITKGFERQIVITDVQDPTRPAPPHEITRRRVDVNVRYRVNQLWRQETMSTIITNYAGF